MFILIADDITCLSNFSCIYQDLLSKKYKAESTIHELKSRNFSLEEVCLLISPFVCLLCLMHPGCRKGIRLDFMNAAQKTLVIKRDSLEFL